jgi:hypothetical protein
LPVLTVIGLQLSAYHAPILATLATASRGWRSVCSTTWKAVEVIRGKLIFSFDHVSLTVCRLDGRWYYVKPCPLPRCRMTRCDATGLLQTLIGVLEQDVRGFAGNVIKGMLKAMPEGCAPIDEPVVDIFLTTSKPTISILLQCLRISFDLISESKVFVQFSDEHTDYCDDFFSSLEELCDMSNNSVDASLRIMSTLLTAQKTTIGCHFRDYLGKPFVPLEPVVLFGGYVTLDDLQMDDDASWMYSGLATLSCTPVRPLTRQRGKQPLFGRF